LPPDIKFQDSIAIDTETKGLNIFLRDRLCVVQISDGGGDAHVVHMSQNDLDSGAKNLRKVLSDEKLTKIFHYARFDIAAIKIYLGIDVENVYCTKIASKLVRTYTDKHSLKDLCNEILDIELSKEQQCSDWGADKLTPQQVDYAASDVLYLHEIKNRLDQILKSENRVKLAQKCFDFLPVRVELDINGWSEIDIFHH